MSNESGRDKTGNGGFDESDEYLVVIGAAIFGPLAGYWIYLRYAEAVNLCTSSPEWLLALCGFPLAGFVLLLFAAYVVAVLARREK